MSPLRVQDEPSVAQICGIDPDSAFDVGAASRRGDRSNNEDAFFIAGLRPTMAVRGASESIRMGGTLNGPEAGLLMIIADGMGGLSHGELASRLAVEGAACFSLSNIVHPPPSSSPRATVPGVRAKLVDAVVAGDSHLRDHAPGSELGTTITLAYIVWPYLYVAHVGDTRAYVLRDGRLEQLTTDHTVAHQIEERSGVRGGADHWNHILWNCLGDENNMPQPEVYKARLGSHDRWLLCSDGLYEALPESVLVDHMLSAQPAQQTAEAIVAAAVAAGATDDATALCGRRLK